MHSIYIRMGEVAAESGLLVFKSLHSYPGKIALGGILMDIEGDITPEYCHGLPGIWSGVRVGRQEEGGRAGAGHTQVGSGSQYRCNSLVTLWWVFGGHDRWWWCGGGASVVVVVVHSGDSGGACRR